jgi:hypothetical protein
MTIKRVLGIFTAAILILSLAAVPVIAGEPISNPLEADMQVSGESGSSSVQLSWATQPTGPFQQGGLSFMLDPGDTVSLWIQIINGEDFFIPRTLFIVDGATANHFDMEVTLNATAPSPTTHPLPWANDAFYFGDTIGVNPAVGFNMTSEFSTVARIRITAKEPGDYTLRVFAVQLPEEEESDEG